MRELESSLQQFAEFLLKGQLMCPKATPFAVRWVWSFLQRPAQDLPPRRPGPTVLRRARARGAVAGLAGAAGRAGPPHLLRQFSAAHRLAPGALDGGRRFRFLAIVDDFSREALALVVDTSIGGRRLVRVLDAVVARRGSESAPATTRTVRSAAIRTGYAGSSTTAPNAKARVPA